MKTHARSCKPDGRICPMEHSYYCKYCGDIFLSDEETHYRNPNTGHIFPTQLWPYCSFTCEEADQQPSDYVPLQILDSDISEQIDSIYPDEDHTQ